jgi:hypothetical protein
VPHPIASRVNQSPPNSSGRAVCQPAGHPQATAGLRHLQISARRDPLARLRRHVGAIRANACTFSRTPSEAPRAEPNSAPTSPRALRPNLASSESGHVSPDLHPIHVATFVRIEWRPVLLKNSPPACAAILRLCDEPTLVLYKHHHRVRDPIRNPRCSVDNGARCKCLICWRPRPELNRRPTA